MSNVTQTPRRRLFAAGRIPPRREPRQLVLITGDSVKTFLVHSRDAITSPTEAA